MRNPHLKITKPKTEAPSDQHLLIEGGKVELHKWAERLDVFRIPPRLPHLYQLATNLIQQRGKGQSVKIEDHWLTRFFNRHPAIAAWFAAHTNQERDAGTEPASSKSFFDRLGEVRSRHHILAGDSWNTDEKGYALGVAKKAKVVCRRNRKIPPICQPGNREWVTLMEAISALGQCIPGFFIYLAEAQLMGNHDYDDRDNATLTQSPPDWSND